jgi:hypothetical protein
MGSSVVSIVRRSSKSFNSYGTCRSANKAVHITFVRLEVANLTRRVVVSLTIIVLLDKRTSTSNAVIFKPLVVFHPSDIEEYRSSSDFADMKLSKSQRSSKEEGNSTAPSR